jgi:hypothetical protein
VTQNPRRSKFKRNCTESLGASELLLGLSTVLLSRGCALRLLALLPCCLAAAVEGFWVSDVCKDAVLIPAAMLVVAVSFCTSWSQLGCSASLDCCADRT